MDELAWVSWSRLATRLDTKERMPTLWLEQGLDPPQPQPLHFPFYHSSIFGVQRNVREASFWLENVDDDDELMEFIDNSSTLVRKNIFSSREKY